MTDRSPTRFSTSEAGFTLLEVMGAFIILSLAIAGLVYMGSIGTKGNTRSQDEATAVALATDKLEYLKNIGFDSATSGSDTSTIYSRTWTVGSQYTLNSVPAKDLSVSVSWTGGGSVSLTTTIAELPTFSGSGAMSQFPTAMVTSWSAQ